MESASVHFLKLQELKTDSVSSFKQPTDSDRMKETQMWRIWVNIQTRKQKPLYSLKERIKVTGCTGNGRTKNQTGDSKATNPEVS